MADQLVNGRRFQALTILDIFIWGGVAIEVGLRLQGDHVVAVLDRLSAG